MDTDILTIAERLRARAQRAWIACDCSYCDPEHEKYNMERCPAHKLYADACDVHNYVESETHR